MKKAKITKAVMPAKKKLPKNHKLHLMQRVSMTTEEITVRGSSMTQQQKRIVITYKCVCDEEDIFYRQTDHPGFLASEYSKEVQK